MHLTNKEPIRSDALAASGRPDATGAPANEIEITPEMLAAGVSVLLAIDYDVETHEDVVRELLTDVFKNNPRGGAYHLKFPCY